MKVHQKPFAVAFFNLFSAPWYSFGFVFVKALMVLEASLALGPI